jgi:N-acyl-D-aspartate/D-glutamate deacylase
MSIDSLIAGGRVVDGTGNPWRYGYVAIRADRIAHITPSGQIPPGQVRELVDARGMVVCSGFIDIQSHSIQTLMRDGRSLSKITQGVTTEIMGEAWTPAPFGGRIDDPFANALFVQDIAAWAEQAREWRHFRDWLEALATQGVSPNIGSFLGGGTLRQYACAMRMGPATPDELTTMRHVMDEANVRMQLGLPWIKIAADAGGHDPAWAAPLGPVHPRAYGTYPRVLGRYVRDERVLSLEDAVRKMTSAVADRLGLRERGLLHPGCYADVVVFDAATIADQSTFEAPHQLARGVRDVWVNGEWVLLDGAHIGATPGRVVTGPGRRDPAP